MSKSEGDVWDRAQKALDEGSSHRDERSALRARFVAYIAERRACEAKGTVPRGVRRRGERLLEEVSALEERLDPVADQTAETDQGVVEEDGATRVTDPARRRETAAGEARPPPPPRISPRGTRPPSRGRGG
jgi:hypothetical protein